MPETPANARMGQEHFFADPQDIALGVVDSVDEQAPPASMWKDAWHNVRRRPLFWIASVLILLVIIVAIFPSLFTSVDPRFCELKNSVGNPGPRHAFGLARHASDIHYR